jgi:phosphate transport system substrate-binding protein
MTTHRRFAAPALLALGLAGALVLTACSQSDQQDASDLVANAQAQDYAAQQAAQRRVSKANAALPERTSGQVAIDGLTTATLTSDEVTRYNATGSSTTLKVSQHTQDQAFQELCAGKIDLVNSERRITRAEWEACQSVGLDVVQFQIASEGVVIAIRSESDVGGDCLTTDQVQEIWRAGSPITNWSQLGLDDIPLKVGGPSQSGFPASFDAFGKIVLGSAAPSQNDLRSDYFSYDRFDQARQFLSGGTHNNKLAQKYADRARQLGQRKSELVSARQVRVDAQDELSTAKAERAKGIKDKRTPAAQAKDEARVVAASAAATKADHAAAVARTRYEAAKSRAAVAADARRAVETSIGHVLYTRFSSYELFEEEMRPFEISLPDGHRNCVFPSQTTITSGDYPLSTQLLVTTTTRSLARKEVQGFLTHYLNASQDAAANAQLIGLPNDTLKAELEWVDGTRAPVLVVPAAGDATTTTTAPSDDPSATDSAAPAR